METSTTEGVDASRPEWIKRAIRAGQPYHIQTKLPWRHNAINLGALALILVGIGLVACAGASLPAWAYLPWAPFAFGLLYFGAFVLVVHEASHDMFVISRNKRFQSLANRIAGWSVAVFFATHYGKHWEDGHLEHHVRPLEENDPQAHTAVGPVLLRRVVGSVFVPGYLFLDRLVFRKKPKSGKSSSSAGVIIAFVLLWMSAVGLGTWLANWAVGLALFLGVHVIVGLNHLKGALEHGGELHAQQDAFLRSRTTLFLGRRILMPFNISLHFEHHLNYRVPWYDLVRYHEDLKAIVPAPMHDEVWNRRPMRQLKGALGAIGSDVTPSASPS